MGDGIAKEENLETQIIPLTNENFFNTAIQEK
jgi:hypothetical protein